MAQQMNIINRTLTRFRKHPEKWHDFTSFSRGRALSLGVSPVRELAVGTHVFVAERGDEGLAGIRHGRIEWIGNVVEGVEKTTVEVRILVGPAIDLSHPNVDLIGDLGWVGSSEPPRGI